MQLTKVGRHDIQLLRARYGDIPEDKLARVDAITQDYERLERTMRQATPTEQDSPQPFQAWSRALDLSRRERRADLAAILTPAELDEYEMHTTTIGKALLDSLKEIATTPEERRALYHLREDYNVPLGPGFFSASVAAANEKARLAMYEQMRAVLGDERFGEFLKRDDQAFRRFAKIAEINGQPERVGYQAWQLKSEYTMRLGQLPARFDPESEAWLQQRAALAGEIRSRIAALFREGTVTEFSMAFEWLPESQSNGDRTVNAR